jgi:hypothetical protein
MEKADIETYFRALLSEYKQNHSRSLIFFLTVERKYFESKKNRDGLSFKEIVSKVFGPNKVDLSGLRVSESKKMVVAAL